jgi:hypothetical protein
LQAGRTGTVVCCDSLDCTGQILVSWHFHALGAHDTRSCPDAAPTLIRPGSASLVDPDILRLITLPAGFNETGVISQSGSCLIFQSDTGRQYNLADGGWLRSALTAGPIRFGDHVRVRGLHTTGAPRAVELGSCPAQSGDIHEPIITLVAPAGAPGNGGGNGGGNGPNPACPDDKLILDFLSNEIRLTKDAQCGNAPRAFSGTLAVGISTTSDVVLSVTVTPSPGTGGTWTATVTPEQIAAGDDPTAQIHISVAGLDLTTIPAGESIVVGSFELVATPPEP